MAVKVKIGDFEMIAESEADLQMIYRTFGHSTNGKSHIESPVRSSPQAPPARAEKPASASSVPLAGLLATLPDRQRELLQYLDRTLLGSATDRDICEHFGVDRTYLNGTLMTLSKRAGDYRLKLGDVISKTIERDKNTRARIYTYKLTNKMRAAIKEAQG